MIALWSFPRLWPSKRSPSGYALHKADSADLTTAKHYCIVSGTGRAGTTLLVRVLGRAGLNVGFDLSSAMVDGRSHAGLELDILQKPAAYVVKSPWIATHIEEILARPDIVIDHAIVCVRDLHEAAASRRRVQALNGPGPAAGGLWLTQDPELQEVALAGVFYRLVYGLTKSSIPTTFLHFPRFARDPDYFADSVRPIFPAIGSRKLKSALQQEVRLNLINDFTGDTHSEVPA